MKHKEEKKNWSFIKTGLWSHIDKHYITPATVTP